MLEKINLLIKIYKYIDTPLLSLKAEYNRTKSLKPELGLWLSLAKLIQP